VQEGGSKKTPYLYTSKEFDQETGLYYYGARYYDPRTSLWVSADPILEKYLPDMRNKKQREGGFVPELDLPSVGGVYNTRNLSVYAYVAQNPVILSDPNGNEIDVKGSPEFKIKVATMLNDLSKTETGRKVVQALDKSDNVITIREGSVNRASPTDRKAAQTTGSGTNISINLDPDAAPETTFLKDGVKVKEKPSPSRLLSHELAHARLNDAGKYGENNEEAARGAENKISSEMGDNRVRQYPDPLPAQGDTD